MRLPDSQELPDSSDLAQEFQSPPPPSQTTNNRDKKKREVVATLFVDRTHNNLLLDKLKKEEELLTEITGYKVKLVEKNGTKLEQLLVKRDPFEGWDCSRGDCICCIWKPQFNQSLNCNKQNVLYRAECMQCKET